MTDIHKLINSLQLNNNDNIKCIYLYKKRYEVINLFFLFYFNKTKLINKRLFIALLISLKVNKNI